jgi:photosystem II stability/assembly factor-like uncharacterized protein
MASAQPGTIYMSVLSSQKHQWGNIENPVIGIFRSSDAGRTWEHIGWQGYIRTFYTETGPHGTIWAGCGNGVLRSVDNGKSFTITTGWEVTEALKVRVHPYRPEIVYAATAYGVYKTIDNGNTWREMNNGLPALPFTSDLLIDRSDPEKLFAATEDGIYVSYDAAGVWNRAGLKGNGIRTIVQHPNAASVFYVGTEENGIYISKGDGLTWNQINDGLEHLTVYSIAMDGSNPDVLYAGTHGGGVYRSINGGSTWQQGIDGLTNLDVHALLILPSDSNVVFAGTLNGGLFVSYNGGDNWVFNSQDGGQVWGLSVTAGKPE